MLFRSSEDAKRAATRLTQREAGLDRPYNFEFWWSGIVWGTASAALHNMLQQERWCDDHEHLPLRLDDEPLSYLGVLVDCLQDWDRYFVFDSASRQPVQGQDVRLGVEAGKVVVEFPGSVSKLRKDLDLALDGWADLVELRGTT